MELGSRQQDFKQWLTRRLQFQYNCQKIGINYGKKTTCGSLAGYTLDVSTPRDLAVRQYFLLSSLDIVNTRYLYTEVK